MELREFERLARGMWDEIPDEYKEGVDGLTVERRALPHPTLGDVYTLGECLTEAYPSDYGGPETIRSVVVLYWGSFRELARRDPDFDWDDELWETLTHELRHHLESLAAEAGLEDVDYAADQNFRRVQGEPFDASFYRAGEEAAPGVWRIERDFFVEIAYEAEAGLGPYVSFDWHGSRYRVPRPEPLGDVCFVEVTDGVDAGPGGLVLVLVRRRGLWESLRALLGRTSTEVVEAWAAAERVDAVAGMDGTGAE